MNVARRIGLELTRARRAAGLRQAELASLIGTTQSAISRVEAGRVAASAELIERIAQALGKPIRITFGAPITEGERRRRVRRALGDYRFDPWEREPSEVEARALEAGGFRRD